MKLFLDDRRNPGDVYLDGGWITCRSVYDMMKFLRLGGVTHVSLDGDMGLDKFGRDLPGGLELLDWMRETDTWPTRAVLVHSQDPPKALAMRTIIELNFIPTEEAECLS